MSVESNSTHQSRSFDCDNMKRELIDRILSVENVRGNLQQIRNCITGQSISLLLQLTADAFFAKDWNNCRTNCNTLLNLIWEHLNTGNWKDVDLSWRHAYTIVSIFLAVSEFAILRECDSVRSVIRICDMGLLMGAPLMSNLLARLADEFLQISSSLGTANDVHCSKNLNEGKRFRLETSAAVCNSTMGVPSGEKVMVEICPSLDHFHKTFMLTGTPVILKKCIGHWPCMNERRWSTDYLRSVAGCRLVPVELGSKYTDDAWSQTLITIDDFIDRYVNYYSPAESTCSVGYLAQHQLFDQIPRLQRDIAVPDYCALSTNDDYAVVDNVDINAWFGPSGTVSPLHRDAKHNLLAQVVGRKYIRLYEREATDRLYPFTSPLLETTSQVDVENPDMERFPLFAGLKFKDFILDEGDMLYIPALYWHFVRSLSVSFSVSFWWN